MPSSAEPPQPPAGGEDQRIATGTIAIQAATLVNIAVFVAVATALGRTLSLEEFGVYGLTLSISLYVQFVQGSVETAAIKAIAEAGDEEEVGRAVTGTFAAYGLLGGVAAVLIAGGGNAIIGLFDIPAELLSEARLGLLALGGVTWVGWLSRTFRDVLHGRQRFVVAAVVEVGANVVFAGLMLSLILAGAPLWVIIAAGGSFTLLSGLIAAIAWIPARVGVRIRRSALDRAYLRRYGGFSAYVLASAVTDVVIYQLDRAVLGAFRNAATIGLYEGIVRPQTLVRTLQGTLVVTVFPATARYIATGDTARVEQLLVRGTRYVAAIVLPVAVTVTVLAGPILEAWLGEKYGSAGLALSIFVSYWILGVNIGVATSMLWSAGRARALAGMSWTVAALNLGLSLALTPILGLEGVVLGTTLAYLAVFPYLIHLVTTTLGVSLRTLAREVWIPAYSVAAVAAILLVAARLLLPLEEVLVLLAVCSAVIVGSWAAFYVRWLRADERQFFRGLAGGILGAPRVAMARLRPRRPGP